MTEVINSFTVEGCKTCPALTRCRMKVDSADRQIDYLSKVTSAVLRGIEAEGSEEAAVGAMELLGDIGEFEDFYADPDDSIEELTIMSERIDTPSGHDFMRKLLVAVDHANAGVALERTAIEMATLGCPGALHEETAPPEGRHYGSTIITCQSSLEEANGTSIRLG